MLMGREELRKNILSVLEFLEQRCCNSVSAAVTAIGISEAVARGSISWEEIGITPERLHEIVRAVAVKQEALLAAKKRPCRSCGKSSSCVEAGCTTNKK